MGTGTYGVYVESTTGTLIGGTTPGARNLASGNLHGIAIISGSSNIVQGNFVGTDASGLKALGNDHYGIYIGPDAPGSLIGGTSPGAGNLVSANGYDGLQIRAPGILIQGNTIGTDLTGTNDLFNGQNAILINDTAPFCQVGGTNAAARNIASGNNGIGVLSSSNVIQGNYVGVGADGRTIVGAPAFGIATGGLTTGNLLGGDKVGAGNVVAGQFGDGIRIAGSNQVVQGNFIGTDATGTLPRPNHINGTIFGNNNLIGGLTPGAGNLISGNGSTGLDISDTAATGNTIQGNFIGTDLTGTNALPNGNTGLSIEYAAGNLIGGTSPGSRNVISGNGGYGLGIVYDSASNNVVQGNYVGLAADGATALPNFAGLRTVNAHDNLIGGTVAGARNIIAQNQRYGISAIGGASTNNAFLGNSIFGNGWSGIDLAEDGISANDPGDSDDGPNHLQNFPELASATLVSGNLTVRYRVDSAPANAPYPMTVEFFLADGAGQGRTLIYRHTYGTAQTFTNITFTPTATVSDGAPIVATATDANGNTSEFSGTATAAANHRPAVAQQIPDQSGSYGAAFSYTFPANTFADPDAGDTLSYGAGGLPTGISFNGTSRTLSGAPTASGSFVVTITATDNGTPPLSTNDTFLLVVAKAPLLATADNKSRLPGQANPTVTGSLVGLTNNDAITMSFSTTATPASPPGNYPITPLLNDPGTRLPNYLITTNPGTLTVIDCSTLAMTNATLPSAFEGTAYSVSLRATNGAAPYSFALTSGTLPNNVTLSPGGFLSGTPTNTGNFPVAITVTDNLGCTVGSNYTLVVTCPNLTLSPSTLAGLVKDTAYSTNFSTANGTAPYTYAVTVGTLPGGLTLSSAGLLSGTPTNAGSFTFTVRSTDAAACTGTASYTVSVEAPVYEGFAYAAGTLNGQNGGADFSTAWGGSGPSVISNSFALGGPTSGNHVEGADGTYTRRLNVSIGAPGTVRYLSAVVAYVRHTFGPPPPQRVGLVLNGTTGSGLFAGKPNAGSPLNFVLENAAGGGQVVAPPIPAPGGFFMLVVKCEFFAGNDRFTLYFNPPLGQPEPASGTTKFDSDLGSVTNIALTISGSDGFTTMGFDEIRLASTYAAVTPSCPTITLSPSSLPDGAYGVPFSQTLSASGGTAPYLFSVTSGVLPGGLTLSTNGLLSGTPTSGGTYNFFASAADATGCSASRAYSLTVPCPTITVNPAVLPPVIRGTPYSQTLTASGGVAPYTFSIAFGALLNGFTLSSSGTISGTATNYATSSFGMSVTDATSCSQIFNYTLSALPDRWVGDGSANQWNLSAPNWDRGLFHNGDDVLFDDTGSNSPAVNITTTLSPASVSVDNNKTYSFAGTGGITGTSTVSKTSSGELRVATSNSYSGVTLISNGRLTVQNNSALGTTNGATVVTGNGAVAIDGSGLNISEPLTLAANYINSGFCSPTNASLINLAQSNTWSGPITLAPASSAQLILSKAGLLTLNNPSPIAGSNGLVISGSGDVLLTSGIGSNVGLLQPEGPGKLILTGPNASSAGMSIGCFGNVIAAPASLGSGPVSITSGCSLEIDLGGSASLGNNLLFTGGKLRANGGTVSLAGGSLQIDGGNGATFETINASDRLIFNSPLRTFGNGTFGTVFINGPGAVVLNSGLTVQNGGPLVYYWQVTAGATLQLNHTNAITFGNLVLSGGKVQTGVDSGGIFTSGTTSVADGTIQPGRSTSGSGVSNYFGDLSVSTMTVQPGSNLLAGSTADLGFGNTQLPDGDAIIQVQNNASVSARVTLSGIVSAGFGSAGGLVKAGNGTLVLTADNSYTGHTVVSNGTLKVSNPTGTATGSGVVRIFSGGFLSGTGKIAGPVSVRSGGTLSPGNSVGTLAISNNLVFGAGATNLMELFLNLGTNDKIVGLSNLTYGGTLLLSRLVSLSYTNGSAFKLFNAQTYNGVFATLSPATPGTGLQWDVTTLGVDGTLRIVTGTNQAPFVANHIADQNAAYGAPFNFTFPANTFSDPDAGQVLTYSAIGMPPGIALNPSTRTFSGSTTSRGRFDVTVIATDNGPTPMSTSDTFGIVVPLCPTIVLSPSGTLAQPTVGSAYTVTLTANGGVAPHHFNLTSGALPLGLALSSAGVLSGTPSNSGSYTFAVTATDSENCSGSANYFFFVRTNGPGTVTLTTARSGHTATLLPNGEVLVAGGDGGYASAELYDPATGGWKETAPMNTPRFGATATLLPNGQVLVAGGNDIFNGIDEVSSAELYDPATGYWSFTASMVTPHFWHTATLLPDGRVLVAGTYHNDYNLIPKAEVYDPTSRTWSAVAPMNIGRYQHTATLLPNGKVLVAGGSSFDNTGGPHLQTSAEIFDPQNGTWTMIASMNNSRYLHTATLLADGRVLAIGGFSAGGVTASAELYDPGAGTWSVANPLSVALYSQSSTLLPNGLLLVAGGANNNAISNLFLYDPSNGVLTSSASLTNARSGHTATLLPSGKVLLAGGYGVSGDVSSCEFFESSSASWSATGSLPTARTANSSVLLPNGNLLVVGGVMTIGGDHPLTECDLYNPITRVWTVTGSLLTTREVPTVTLLPNGKVLAAGGYDVSTGAVATVELYDPSTGLWVTGVSLNTPRASHTATLLANGKVLVTGGFLGSDRLTTSEIYDPSSGAWTPSGSLHMGRAGHTATLLPDGRVLVAGGYGAGALNYLPSTELFDPTTETWTLTGSLAVTRYNHTANLLPNGSVVLVGGFNGTNLSSAEAYDPSTGSWALINQMSSARYHHTAVLLENGKLLVTAGVSPGGIDRNAELYDPAARLWQATAPLATARYGHAASLLANGKVLVSGGYNSNDLASVELYDPGLGYSPAWQPQIATTSSPLYAGDSLALGGSRFRGVSGGSCGNGQDSPADQPLVQLRALESGVSLFLPPASWSGNSFISAPIAAFPHGYALATVFVNGIPSASSFVSVSGTRSVSIQVSPSGIFCWPADASSYVLECSTNLAPPITWQPVTSGISVTGTNNCYTVTPAPGVSRRFYRLRSP